DRNNIYEVVVRVSDDAQFDEQRIAVVVSDQPEAISPVAKFGNELLVNTSTLGHQMQPAIAAFSNGRFVEAWADFASFSSPVIRVQVLDADGSRLGDEITIPTTVDRHQYKPAIATLADGRFVVAWSDDSATNPSDIHAQIFNLDGTRAGGEFLIN